MRLVHLRIPGLPEFFPDPRRFGPWAGALSESIWPELMIDAYGHGIFPWPAEEMDGIPWCCPPLRGVIDWKDFKVNRTLRKALRRGGFEVTFDQAFDQVIAACHRVHRDAGRGVWLVPELRRAMAEAHGLGFAHSVEVWRDGALGGGLYGVSLGRAFFAESMFTGMANGSKIALAALCAQLESWGFDFLDCQQVTPATAALGASETTRSVFLSRVARAMEGPTRLGRWRFELEAGELADWRFGGA